MIELLKKELTPEPIPKPEFIGLCTPSERGNFVLGLYLYQIEENGDYRPVNRVNVGEGYQKEPPMSLTLQYMISIYSKADIAVRSIDEQRILGKTMQVFYDYQRLRNEQLIGTLRDHNEVVNIQNMNVPMDEKAKIWSLFNEPYQTSLFYQVGPVFLESTKLRRVRRVTDLDISLKER